MKILDYIEKHFKGIKRRFSTAHKVSPQLVGHWCKDGDKFYVLSHENGEYRCRSVFKQVKELKREPLTGDAHKQNELEGL